MRSLLRPTSLPSRLRFAPVLTAVLAVALTVALPGYGASRVSSAVPGAAASVPRPVSYLHPVGSAVSAKPRRADKIGHVFVINIENEDAAATWGPDSEAPFLAKTLRAKGTFLSSYYGIGHNSLPNYIAQISGQAPNTVTQSDCQMFTDFVATAVVAPDQAVGQGCVYPRGVDTLPMQLQRAHLPWKGYLDDMKRPCVHPSVGGRDGTQGATTTHEYATRHNPFMYFHSIIDNDKLCRSHVIQLTRMPRDLKKVYTTPRLAYITPDLCNDGHDAPCADGRPGGLKSVNEFMKKWVPQILASPAFKKDGLLIITSDESEGANSDASACCETATPPNTPAAGISGPGGGRIGALLISRFVKAGHTSTTPYNHYSMLGSIEEVFGLDKLGYAQRVQAFGPEVYPAKRHR